MEIIHSNGYIFNNNKIRCFIIINVFINWILIQMVLHIQSLIFKWLKNLLNTNRMPVADEVCTVFGSFNSIHPHCTDEICQCLFHHRCLGRVRVCAHTCMSVCVIWTSAGQNWKEHEQKAHGNILDIQFDLRISDFVSAALPFPPFFFPLTQELLNRRVVTVSICCSFKSLPLLPPPPHRPSLMCLPP